MSRIRRFFLRLLNTVRPGEPERQLQREVSSHLAMLEEDSGRGGMSADDARFAARRAFHGVEQAKEMQRDARSFGWLEDARRDLVYGPHAAEDARLHARRRSHACARDQRRHGHLQRAAQRRARSVSLFPLRSPRQCRPARTAPVASFAARISAPRSSSTIRSRPPRSRTSSARASSAPHWIERRRRRAPGAQLDDAERLRLSRRAAAPRPRLRLSRRGARRAARLPS